jgi:hypothetical protein
MLNSEFNIKKVSAKTIFQELSCFKTQSVSILDIFMWTKSPLTAANFIGKDGGRKK